MYEEVKHINTYALNTKLTVPEKKVVSKAPDTKNSIYKDSSFLDKLSNTAINETKDNKQEDISITKVKSILAEEGFTPKEIDSIKNLKDLKELLISKAKDGTLKIDKNLNNLLGMIGSLLGPKAQQNFADIKKLCDSVLPQIKAAVIKAGSSGNTTDALKSFQNETDNILNENKQAIESLKPENLKLFKAILTNEVKNVGIKVPSELSSKILKEITLILDKYKSENSVIKLNQGLPDVKSSTEIFVKDAKGSQQGDKKSSDDSILNKLAEPDKKSNKIDKATNFMTQFINTKASAKIVSTEKPTIDISNVNADIVKSLKFMQQGDIKNLTVKITPKELGDVIINLTMENGVMKASITASNKEAYNLINSNMTDINAKLQNSNMAVQDLSLNIYNQDTTFFKNGSNEQQQQQANKNTNGKTTGIIETAEAIINQSILNSNVNILA